MQGFMVCERELFSVIVMGCGEKKEEKKEECSESGEHTVVPMYPMLH